MSENIKDWFERGAAWVRAEGREPRTARECCMVEEIADLRAAMAAKERELEAMRKDAETIIPHGWLFNSADFSCLAYGSRDYGGVMLVRDAVGRVEFHALPADSPEREAFQLYVSGKGKTLREAIAAAVASIGQPVVRGEEPQA